MIVEITFTHPDQVAAFLRAWPGWPLAWSSPLVAVVDVPPPFDDPGGVRDLLEDVEGPLSWRIMEEGDA